MKLKSKGLDHYGTIQKQVEDKPY